MDIFKTIPRLLLHKALESMGVDPTEAVEQPARDEYSRSTFGVHLERSEQVPMLFAELALTAATRYLYSPADIHATLRTLVDLADAHRLAGLGSNVFVHFPGWTLAD